MVKIEEGKGFRVRSRRSTWLFLISITSYLSLVVSNVTLFPNQFFSDGETLVSSNQKFEIGLF